MRRSHFQATGTELDVYIVVFDYRNHPVYQRNDHLFAFQPSVLRVVRVDTHGGIAHDCLRTGSCHDGIASFGIAFHLVAKVIQLAVFFLIYNLFVGQGGQCLRVPVDHADAAIDQSFLEQVDKDLDYAF